MTMSKLQEQEKAIEEVWFRLSPHDQATFEENAQFLYSRGYYEGDWVRLSRMMAYRRHLDKAPEKV